MKKANRETRVTAASMNRTHDCTRLPKQLDPREVKYHYRQPNLSDGKDESEDMGRGSD